MLRTGTEFQEHHWTHHVHQDEDSVGVHKEEYHARANCGGVDGAALYDHAQDGRESRTGAISGGPADDVPEARREECFRDVSDAAETESGS